MVQGGHVNTWVDPATGRGFDAGVQNYIDLGGAKSFFTRLGVSTQPNVRQISTQVHVDFATGQRLTNYTLPSSDSRSAALRRYLAVAEQYHAILEPGWWAFPEPRDIPADLLLSFREFVLKYNLTEALPQILGTTGLGVYDVLNTSTLWVMRSFNVDMCRAVLSLVPSFVPVSRKNQDLYDAIFKLLDSDVLVSTTVTGAKRTDKDGVVLEVRNSLNGSVSRIVAKRILFTAAPSDGSTKPFDLDEVEKKTLGAFNYTASFVGVVSHPSLPLNTSIGNVPAAAQPTNWFSAVPSYPFTSRFDNYANSPYFRVVVGGEASLTVEEAQKVVINAFNKLVETGIIKQTDPPQSLTFHEFEPHGLVSAYVSREELHSGFIQRLNSLQGRRSTWYTGSTWGVQFTTGLWIFTDTVLPKLVESLKKA